LHKKKGYLICGRNNCGKTGHIIAKFPKSRVQIPIRKNIVGPVKALDYNAKIFYRLYQKFSFVPSGEEIHYEVGFDHYQRVVSFSPFTEEEIKAFELKVWDILLKNSIHIIR
jgi:hypothetical protein